MKVLVTGGTGFIGSNLVKRLDNRGYEIKVLIRDRSNLGKIADIGVEKIVGDLTDYDALARAVRGIDLVFNLAAGLPYHRLSDQEYRLTNVGGVKNIVDACLKRGVARLVHVSTVGVYGKTTQCGLDEKAPLVLLDAYSRTKALGDKYVFEAIKKHGLTATIIRPTIAYGPQDTRPGFSNLFALIKRKMFVPIGDGENYFHTIYVENLIDALLLAASSKNAVGEDFIVGDDPCPKMIEIIKTIAKAEQVKEPRFNIPTSVALGLAVIGDLVQKLGLPSPLNTQRVRFITQNRRYSIKKAKQLLGYKPKIGLEEGVRRTYLWYKKHGYIS